MFCYQYSSISERGQAITWLQLCLCNVFVLIVFWYNCGSARCAGLCSTVVKLILCLCVSARCGRGAEAMEKPSSSDRAELEERKGLVEVMHFISCN